jgi:hypothetical protein
MIVLIMIINHDDDEASKHDVLFLKLKILFAGWEPDVGED